MCTLLMQIDMIIEKSFDMWKCVDLDKTRDISLPGTKSIF